MGRAPGTSSVVLLWAGCTPDAAPTFGSPPPDGSTSLAPTSSDGDDDDDAPDPGAPSGLEDRVIYLVMPDRFADGDPANNGLGVPGCYDPANPVLHHGGDWRGLTDRLDYLEELGVDAVWITPPFAQVPPTVTSCGYHGYWGDFRDPDDRAVEPRLGTPDDLQALSDALHARDMALVLDLVPNHAGRGATLLAQHPDWFHDDADCAASADPTVDCSLSGLPDFDQDLPEVSAYLTAQAEHWVTTYDVDMVRLDTAKHVPAEWLGQTWVPALGGRPVIAEIYDEGGYDLIERYLDAGLPTAFDFPLRRAMVDALGRGGSIDLVASRVHEAVDRFGEGGANRLVHMLDNHDVWRFAEEVMSRPEEERAARLELGYAVLMTAPGVPQLTWGAELGQRGGTDPDNRRDLPSWAFDPGLRAGERDGFVGDPAENFAALQAWIAVRRDHPALSIGTYAEVWRHNGSGPQVWVSFRSSGEDRVIVVVHAGTTPSGPFRIHLQASNEIDDVDKLALPDGVPLVPAPSGTGILGVRVEGGELVFDGIPALTAVVLAVGRSAETGTP